MPSVHVGTEVHMFPGFAQVWTAVTLAKNLTRKKPLAVKVAGEAVVRANPLF